MNTVCAMSLTGDPITIGHLDIAKRAWKMFGNLKLFMPVMSSKKGSMLSFQERKEVAEYELKLEDIVGAEVLPIEDGQAFVDVAKAAGCNVIVRGLRNGQDLIYETDMAAVNRMLDPSIETIYLPCKSELSFVSSSSVRELVRLGKWEAAERFTSSYTMRKLKRKVTHVVALTGGIACGKSTACKTFEKHGWSVLSADDVNRNEVLGNYAKLHDIAEELKPWGNVDTSNPAKAAYSIAPIVFNNDEARDKLEAIAIPAILRYVNKYISDWRCCPSKKIVVEVPLLFEPRTKLSAGAFKDYDTTVCIYSDEDVARRRLMQNRGLSYDEAVKRLRAQCSPHAKIQRCDYAIQNNGSEQWFEASLTAAIQDIEESRIKCCN